MSFDTEVLIIGAGMSGLGLAVQIIRNFGIKNFELVEKSEDVGGTWLANTYPGCGCDVCEYFSLCPNHRCGLASGTDTQVN